jgi:hypothetical protein
MWWKSDALFGPFFEEQLSMCRRARIKKQKWNKTNQGFIKPSHLTKNNYCLI